MVGPKVTKPRSNFKRLDPGRLEIAFLVDAMLRARPVLFSFFLYCGRVRVLALDPVPRAAEALRWMVPLRDDALERVWPRPGQKNPAPAWPTVVFLATNTQMVQVIREKTSTIPIVFVQVPDPIGSGFVESIARPGGPGDNHAFNKRTYPASYEASFIAETPSSNARSISLPAPTAS